MEAEKKSGRISSRKKTELVVELLRGSSIEELCRTNKIPVHQLSQWRDVFIKAGSNGFKKQAVKSREAELERIIGRQQLEIELLKKK